MNDGRNFKEEQAAGGNPIQQEAITKAVEEAIKKKEEELAEKLVKATEGAKMEEESKNKLQFMKLQRQLNEANAKIASYEKQYGPAPGAHTTTHSTIPTTSSTNTADSCPFASSRTYAS